MSRIRPLTGTGPTSSPAAARIFEATLGPGGSVVRGAEITQARAEVGRASGLDVVVCGPRKPTNSRLARTIEVAAGVIAPAFQPAPASG